MSLALIYAGIVAFLTCLIQVLKTMTISAVLLLITIIAYRLFLHPLSAIPGPRLAAASNVWHAYHARNGRMAELGKTLHRRYGPVVRVGPNEVWFDSKEAFRTIYKTGSGYEKSDFYLATSLTRPTHLDWLFELHFPDTLDLLSDRDARRYRLQRRLIGPVYQTSNLLRYEAAIDTVIAQAIAKIKNLNGAEVELNEWMHIIAVECLGAVVLSWSPGMLKHGTDWGTGPHAYHGWRRKSVFGLFSLITKLEFWSKDVGRVFSSAWGVNFKTPKGFRPFFIEVSKRVTKRAKAALRPNPPKDQRQDLLADMIQLHKAKPSFTEMYLKRMAITNFGAGHETMASTLTSIMAMIGSKPDVQARVRDEVLAATNPTQHANSVRLSITQAAIKESRRLYPVISMSLPRKVPNGGVHLHGFSIPAGTTVGCNPVSLHRNAAIFGPDPDTFNLDRWIDADADVLRNMERYNLGWGGGSRTCPGRNLAEIVVYKVVPALVKEFCIEAVLPDERDVKAYFLSIMTGVRVRFVPRDGG